MTDDDMIDELIERHPSWKDGSTLVTLRSRGIQALIRQAYAEGRDAGMKRQKAMDALRDIGNQAGIPDPFSQFFGNKR